MTSEILGRVSGGENLSMEEMSSAIHAIMQGSWQEEQIALLLTALHQKGETVDEIAGAAEALRRNMTPIRSTRPRLLDTCGTGGDASGTFNISTAAAIVTAAADVAVAKHGNRGMTSKTGSADVLAELGVNIEATVAQSERCLEEAGICFCFAPLMHQSMRHVAAVRKKLGIRTIFNLLGPLCNPANAQFQLLGVGKPELRPLLANALERLGTERSVVVCGSDGLDEVTLTGATDCTEITKSTVHDFRWTPDQFGLEVCTDKSSMLVNSPADSAEIIRKVFNNTAGPARDIVAINAAAALWTANMNESPASCTQLAMDAITSGAALEKLRHLAELSHA
ncbi:MAG: anthranilate phosphoribosyltransferase [Pirellulaceae bacterium]|nr:anthranilate phosphoribosyltransferase [Pirellulaceae bacterium]